MGTFEWRLLKEMKESHAVAWRKSIPGRTTASTKVLWHECAPHAWGNSKEVQVSE